MNIKVYDNEGNTSVDISVELDKYMILINPKITDENLSYLHCTLLPIRTKYMTEYLYYLEYDKSEYTAKVLEQDIVDEIYGILDKEIKYIVTEDDKTYDIKVEK